MNRTKPNPKSENLAADASSDQKQKLKDAEPTTVPAPPTGRVKIMMPGSVSYTETRPGVWSPVVKE